MKEKLWHRLTYHWRKLDGFVQLSAVIVVINLAAAIIVLPHQQQELAALTRETAYLSGQRAAVGSADHQVADRYFPPSNSLSQVVKKVDDIATRHNLLIDRSNGKFLTIAGNTQLLPFQMDLQVTGEYRDLRGFIDDLLRELPYVAVSDIALNRTSPDETELLMPIRLRIFLSP